MEVIYLYTRPNLYPNTCPYVPFPIHTNPPVITKPVRPQSISPMYRSKSLHSSNQSTSFAECSCGAGPPFIARAGSAAEVSVFVVTGSGVIVFPG